MLFWLAFEEIFSFLLFVHHLHRKWLQRVLRSFFCEMLFTECRNHTQGHKNERKINTYLRNNNLVCLSALDKHKVYTPSS